MFVTPSDSAIADVRQRMMPMEDNVAKELRLSPALVQQVQAELKANGS